jgi:flagellar hook-length control protein FliK
MIELSTQIPQTTTPVSGPAAPGGAAGGFVQLLAAYLDAGADAAPDAPANGALPVDRQGLADAGKTLPVHLVDDKAIDPALIWLPMTLPIPAPVAQPIQVPPASLEGAARAIADPLTGAAASVAAALTPGTMVVADSVATKAGAPLKEGAPSPAEGLLAKDHQPESVARTIAALLAPTTATPAAQPAGQAFAAAIAAAVANHDRPTREDHRSDPNGTGTPILTAQAEATNRPIVHAAADAKHPALDLRDDRGLHGMIDRIEMLRDDANANDTRIRLVPDALGGVDVALRKDGDTLHLHFTADTQATRTLLTEAQPRLAELAEARGVKLGQTSVDAGTGGGANHTNHQARAEIRRAPISAAAPAADDFSTDQRLA